MPSIQDIVRETAEAIPDGKHRFAVRYRSPKGEDLEGTFVARLPTAEDVRQLAVALSGLARGAAWQSLPADIQTLLLAMARCAVLVEESPDWFKRPLDQLGPEIFVAVSEEVARFEADFFRRYRQGGEESRQIVVVQPVQNPR